MKIYARIVLLVVMVMAYLLYALGNKVSALPECDYKSINGTWVNFVSNDCDTVANCSAGNTTLVGSENAEKTYNFFISKGLTPIQAVGIMGNLQAESSIDPNLQEKGGDGFGIAQWSFGRRDALEKAATEKGVPVGDLGFQLDYLYNESTQRDSRSYPGIKEWEGLKRQTTVQDAVFYWEDNYERPAVSHQNIRVQFAEDFLAKYGSSSGAASTPATTAGGCTGAGGGQIVGNPYEDSSAVACAPGTEDRGLADGYNDGVKFIVRLCSLTNLPSSGGADNGYAIVNSRVSGAWFNLVKDAKAAGIDLSAVSSFRSMAQQEALFAANPNPQYVARPGYSSHQAGVAIDFAGMHTKGGQDCGSGRAREPGNAAWQWLVDNAGKYGFKQYSAESWHWDAYPAANRCG